MIVPLIISILALLICVLAVECRNSLKEQKRLKNRVQLLEEQNGELILEYYNAETGPIFDNAPDWTPDDAIALAAFLKTETGRALAKRFQVVAGNQAVAGCQDEMHTTYAAANGNGWNEACQWFLQLSRVTGVQVAKNDESAPEGETQLLERLSP
jgi:hypothetical protein